jgi:hypothetical protein
VAGVVVKSEIRLGTGIVLCSRNRKSLHAAGSQGEFMTYIDYLLLKLLAFFVLAVIWGFIHGGTKPPEQ